MAKRLSMRALLHEHNMLNGFWFVFIEFVLAAVVALIVTVAEFSRGSIAWAIVYFGIAVNSVAICATVIGQMRRGERSQSIAETYFGKGREATRREHPDLDRHTMQLVVATLVPFLLAALTLLDTSSSDEMIG